MGGGPERERGGDEREPKRPERTRARTQREDLRGERHGIERVQEDEQREVRAPDLVPATRSQCAYARATTGESVTTPFRARPRRG